MDYIIVSGQLSAFRVFEIEKELKVFIEIRKAPRGDIASTGALIYYRVSSRSQLDLCRLV